MGATGGRADHTIGNVSLLMEYTRMFDLPGVVLEMISDEGTIFPITDTVEFECGEGRQVSIFSPDITLNIKSEGLMYPTDDVVFDNWWKATLNKASRDTVRLVFNHRSLALVMLN
jgi:thiamine pyrophosphokinase